MAVRKASDSNLTGKKYNDGSAGAAKIADVPNVPTHCFCYKCWY
jgi:hypothetical protein